MANWYEVLQVTPDASPGIIEAAFNVLENSLLVPAQSSPEARAKLAEVRAAIAVLGDAGRRAEYDAALVRGDSSATREPVIEREDLEPEAGMPAIAEHEMAEDAGEAAAVDVPSGKTPETVHFVGDGPKTGGGAQKAIVAVLAVVVLGLIVALAAGLILLLGDDGEDYAVNLNNDDYNLSAMSLVQEDMPPGLIEAQEGAFSNEEWAAIIDETDAERIVNQLDSVGRVRNFVRFFSFENPVEHLGRPYQFVSQSTLFKTEADAEASITEARCDLPLSNADPRPTPEFPVPDLGDGSSGFTLTSNDGVVGDQLDTTICFRTGRIVHSVTQRGLDGTQDVALSVRLAQRMLARVDAVFSGEATPAAETVDTGEEPATSPTP